MRYPRRSEAAIDEASNDPAVITQALGVIARSGNLSELARRTGMSREGLYKALSADGNPSFATVMKIAHDSVCGSTLTRPPDACFADALAAALRHLNRGSWGRRLSNLARLPAERRESGGARRLRSALGL